MSYTNNVYYKIIDSVIEELKTINEIKTIGINKGQNGINIGMFEKSKLPAVFINVTYNIKNMLCNLQHIFFNIELTLITEELSQDNNTYEKPFTLENLIYNKLYRNNLNGFSSTLVQTNYRTFYEEQQKNKTYQTTILNFEANVKRIFDSQWTLINNLKYKVFTKYSDESGEYKLDYIPDRSRSFAEGTLIGQKEYRTNIELIKTEVDYIFPNSLTNIFDFYLIDSNGDIVSTFEPNVVFDNMNVRSANDIAELIKECLSNPIYIPILDEFVTFDVTRTENTLVIKGDSEYFLNNTIGFDFSILDNTNTKITYDKYENGNLSFLEISQFASEDNDEVTRLMVVSNMIDSFYRVNSLGKLVNSIGVIDDSNTLFTDLYIYDNIQEPNNVENGLVSILNNNNKYSIVATNDNFIINVRSFDNTLEGNVLNVTDENLFNTGYFTSDNLIQTIHYDNLEYIFKAKNKGSYSNNTKIEIIQTDFDFYKIVVTTPENEIYELESLHRTDYNLEYIKEYFKEVIKIKKLSGALQELEVTLLGGND